VSTAQERVDAGRSLAARLEERSHSLQLDLLTRLSGSLDRAGSRIHCRRAFETVVTTAVDFGLASMASAAPHDLAIPRPMLSHARATARAQLPLDQVLRGYASGYSVFIEYALCILEEFPTSVASRDVLRPLADQFDRAVNAIASEYIQAAPSNDRLTPALQSRLIEKLLTGQHVDSSALQYDFSGWHVAMMLERRSDAPARLRQVSRRCDVRLLLAELGDDQLTVWFGSGSRKKLETLAYETEKEVENTPIAVGEPSPEFTGWQLTFRQVESIWPYVRHSPNGTHRYADTGLIVAIAVDPVLGRSLKSIYLDPLGTGSDESGRLLETLRAYLSCGRNASSTAASLGLSRQTVRNRLRTVEERLGRSLDQCGAEVEIALRFDRLAESPQ
jgi:hypothetical protein